MKRGTAVGLMIVGLGLMIVAVLWHLGRIQVRPDVTPGEIALIVVGGLICLGLCIFEGRSFEQ